MLISDILQESHIHLLESDHLDKMELLDKLLKLCLNDEFEEQQYNQIRNTLREREESMSTGIGYGIAIPHCSTAFVDDVRMVFAGLNHSVEFQSIDHIPVKVCILIIFPKAKFDLHIALLAKIAGLCNNPELRKRLFLAENPGQILNIVKDYESS